MRWFGASTAASSSRSISARLTARSVNFLMDLRCAIASRPRAGPTTAYFFPDGQRFDPAIPSPESFLGYAIGTHHTRHDRIVAYFQELARLSDRATYQEIGRTYGTA
jgi:hypothetical protein